MPTPASMEGMPPRPPPARRAAKPAGGRRPLPYAPPCRAGGWGYRHCQRRRALALARSGGCGGGGRRQRTPPRRSLRSRSSNDSRICCRKAYKRATSVDSDVFCCVARCRSSISRDTRFCSSVACRHRAEDRPRRLSDGCMRACCGALGPHPVFFTFNFAIATCDFRAQACDLCILGRRLCAGTCGRAAIFGRVRGSGGRLEPRRAVVCATHPLAEGFAEELDGLRERLFRA